MCASGKAGQWVNKDNPIYGFLFTEDKGGVSTDPDLEAPITWFYDAESDAYVIIPEGTGENDEVPSIRLEVVDDILCFQLGDYTYVNIVTYEKLISQPTGSSETEPVETEPIETEPEYKTVEINLDNWQEYFELRLCVSEQRNDFDELTCIYPELTLFLREEWATIVNDMDVAVEYSCTDGYYCQFSYNIETGEMIEGEPVDRNFGGTDDTGTFKMGDYHIEAGYEIVEGIAGNSFTLDGNIASVHRRMYKNVEIVRIQGTITIAE